MNFHGMSRAFATLAKRLAQDASAYPPEVQAEMERASAALLTAKSAMSRAHFRCESSVAIPAIEPILN